MAATPRLRSAWLLAGAAALATGCIVVQPPARSASQPRGHDEHHASRAQGGPPPWAPAHGYRRKHGHQPTRGGESGDVRVVFDSQRGVHVVLGLSDHYWDAGRYYRCDGGSWRVSAHVEGPWVSVEVRDVPIALVRAATSKDVYPARRAD